METYEWQKNKAIVDRMYYTERVFEVNTFIAGTFTLTNLMYANKGYFANICRSRIIPTWKLWAVLTLPTMVVLQWPLTAQERYVQTRKRWNNGKFLYSTFFLEDDENTPAHPADAAAAKEATA